MGRVNLVYCIRCSAIHLPSTSFLCRHISWLCRRILLSPGSLRPCCGVLGGVRRASPPPIISGSGSPSTAHLNERAVDQRLVPTPDAMILLPAHSATLLFRRARISRFSTHLHLCASASLRICIFMNPHLYASASLRICIFHTGSSLGS